MVKKTLKKNNKKSLKSGGSNNVWGDLLKMSIIPSINIKKGGKYNKKTFKRNLYKPFGNRNVNRILKGGFIRGGSTQYFPVNCTKVENNQSVQQINQEGGSSKVWNDLLKMSVVPSLKKKGGKYNKKTLKNKLYKPIGNKINNIMEGGFIRGGSTQYFPVNCTRIDNQPSQIVKQHGETSN
jgi:hypothetical protein